MKSTKSFIISTPTILIQLSGAAAGVSRYLRTVASVHPQSVLQFYYVKVHFWHWARLWCFMQSSQCNFGDDLAVKFRLCFYLLKHKIRQWQTRARSNYQKEVFSTSCIGTQFHL